MYWYRLVRPPPLLARSFSNRIDTYSCSLLLQPPLPRYPYASPVVNLFSAAGQGIDVAVSLKAIDGFDFAPFSSRDRGIFLLRFSVRRRLLLADPSVQETRQDKEEETSKSRTGRLRYGEEGKGREKGRMNSTRPSFVSFRLAELERPSEGTLDDTRGRQRSSDCVPTGG